MSSDNAQLQYLIERYKTIEKEIAMNFGNYSLEGDRIKLIEEKHDIRLKIKELLTNPSFTILTDNKIDLHSTFSNIINGDHDYNIYLHDTNEHIGNISFRGTLKGKPYEGYDGNIGYIIDEKYQGKGYALSALKLMTDKLYKEGIEEIFIATYKTNVPSIKTIEKFGGVLMNKYSTKNINLYRCDLKFLKKSLHKR